MRAPSSTDDPTLAGQIARSVRSASGIRTTTSGSGTTASWTACRLAFCPISSSGSTSGIGNGGNGPPSTATPCATSRSPSSGRIRTEEHVYHLFQVRSAYRDDLLAHLKRHRVDAVVRYPVPIHLQAAFQHHGWSLNQFPVAERLAKELLCLPIRPDLTDGDVAFVSDCVHAFFDRATARRSA